MRNQHLHSWVKRMKKILPTVALSRRCWNCHCAPCAPYVFSDPHTSQYVDLSRLKARLRSSVHQPPFPLGSTMGLDCQRQEPESEEKAENPTAYSTAACRNSPSIELQETQERAISILPCPVIPTLIAFSLPDARQKMGVIGMRSFRFCKFAIRLPQMHPNSWIWLCSKLVDLVVKSYALILPSSCSTKSVRKFRKSFTHKAFVLVETERILQLASCRKEKRHALVNTTILYVPAWDHLGCR